MKKIQVIVLVGLIGGVFSSCENPKPSKVKNEPVKDNSIFQNPSTVQQDDHGSVQNNSDQLLEYAAVVEKNSWDPTEVSNLHKINDDMEASTSQIGEGNDKKLLISLYQDAVGQQKIDLKNCKESQKCNPEYVAEIERSIKIYESFAK